MSVRLSDLSPQAQAQALKKAGEQPSKKRTTKHGVPVADCMTAGKCSCGEAFKSVEVWERRHCSAGHARFELELT